MGYKELPIKNEEEIINVSVRTTEAQTREVFIDVNDLIIELMKDEQNAQGEAAKREIKRLINKLLEIRKIGHERSRSE